MYEKGTYLFVNLGTHGLFLLCIINLMISFVIITIFLRAEQLAGEKSMFKYRLNAENIPDPSCWLMPRLHVVRDQVTTQSEIFFCILCILVAYV